MKVCAPEIVSGAALLSVLEMATWAGLLATAQPVMLWTPHVGVQACVAVP